MQFIQWKRLYYWFKFNFKYCPEGPFGDLSTSVYIRTRPPNTPISRKRIYVTKSQCVKFRKQKKCPFILYISYVNWHERGSLSMACISRGQCVCICECVTKQNYSKPCHAVLLNFDVYFRFLSFLNMVMAWVTDTLHHFKQRPFTARHET